jgi:hypothetical protein
VLVPTVFPRLGMPDYLRALDVQDVWRRPRFINESLSESVN